MNGYETDYWDFTTQRDNAEKTSRSPEFATAFHELNRMSEKVRRFYQSGDFEEVVLNAHKIKELFHLCLQDEYSKKGRYTFSPSLRAHIERDLASLDYWWKAGILAFQEIKIGPEIAQIALTLSEEMRDYMVSYVEYRGNEALRASQSTGTRPIYETQQPARRIIPNSSYVVKKGGLNVEDEGLLFLGRPSIIGCALEYSWIILLLAVLLFGSFFINNITDISLIAALFRGASVILFLFVIARTWASVYSERYSITEREIQVERGIFFKNTAIIPVYHVAAQTVQRSVFDKVLKTGTFVFKTDRGDVMSFKRVYDPKGVFDLVKELRTSQALIEANQTATPPQ